MADGPDAADAETALRTLAEIGPAAAPALPVIRRRIRDRDRRVRRAANLAWTALLDRSPQMSPVAPGDGAVTGLEPALPRPRRRGPAVR
jgi:hypothetical protein